MIDSDGKLAEFLPAIRAAEWVALDTEADSLHAYPEKLCLIQISLAAGDYLVDPLAGMDLGPFWPELKKHDLIMHGSDYDLRLLRKNHNFVPHKIFDTMLASRLLGDREFGLVNLVKKYLDVTLEKGSQKADWARRPLTPRMESYARNDTHYLKALSDILRGQLRERGRLPWLEESCARLVAECARTPAEEPDEVWRIKGSHKLSRAGLAALRELWHWREKEAVAANRPPYFILSHETLIELAAAAVENRETDRLMPRHFSDRRREGLRQAVAAARNVDPAAHPQFRQFTTRRQSEGERRKFAELETKRNQVAAELQIDPTIIASRATLLDLAREAPGEAEGLMSWQAGLLGVTLRP
ncbi:MAG TPA: HRDC domain-containing protein [Verrucomicrobiae bacterium]|nr:HRDC domain-containing protein [Verrucomicrobiae bacterium]